MRKYAIALIVIFVILILGGTAACLYFFVFRKKSISRARFTNTPPNRIDLGATFWGNLSAGPTGPFIGKNYFYEKNTSDESPQFVRYILKHDTGTVSSSNGIAFYINENDELIFTVDDQSGGSGLPSQFGVVIGAIPSNGTTGYNGSAVVNAGDEITLLDTDINDSGTNKLGIFIVSSDFAVFK